MRERGRVGEAGSDGILGQGRVLIEDLMADQLVFTVSGTVAKPAARVSLAEIGLSERQHLQEWVIAHPEILGPQIMVVTFEFNRWWAASGSPLDRLDVLGLDQSGRLVVAELRRDAAPDTAEMQARITRRWRAGSLLSFHIPCGDVGAAVKMDSEAGRDAGIRLGP